MVRVGVLALQGSVLEHKKALSRIRGVYPIEVRGREEIEQVEGLILPGGESTVIGKLIKESGLAESIVKRSLGGMPVWGTCAGMILMAEKIIDEDYFYLGIMNISVRRNAYGGQLDSFCSSSCISEVSDKDIPLVFIRAPWAESAGSHVKILYKLNGRIAAARQNNLLATSFHPELTDNMSFHEYFIKMVTEYSKNNIKQFAV
ncbi:MAG: pyridoxal 5'-phosphate synthase glutaminase subunit PdxT [Clostridia bacterium]|nr:pyridoxal 5'-phosphate synthase glutaminase subunit PdxT [Clostridia bacterium]